jgi:ketosteroid isomerase-like protein
MFTDGPFLGATVKRYTPVGKAVLMGLGLVLTSAPAWCQQPSPVVEQVLKVEKGIAAASNADELRPFYADDVVLYDMLTPGEFHGWKAVHDDFAAQFAQIKNPKVEILSISAAAEGKMAYAYSTQRFSFDLPNGGPHTEIVFRQTDILKKVKGHWLVEHQHLSVPYDPASGKAVLSPPSKP